MSYIYKHAILGGTFDHLHLGHQKLLSAAFGQAKSITVGIVKSPFSLDKSYVDNIENYELRENSLKKFLEEINCLSRANIISIHDIYGTSLIDKDIEAIFVTESTQANAETINLKRLKLGIPALTIVVIPFTVGDDNKIISSRRIRSGEINRQGISYLKFFLQKDNYLLPAKLRTVLQEPFGTIVSEVTEIGKIIPSTSLVISIGDIVSQDLKKAEYPTGVSIIDYRTRREEIDKKIIERYFPIINYKLANPAGTINKDIARILTKSLTDFQKSKETQIVAVTGEEDLLALPVILLSPLHSFVIYGQHKVGMIVVKVTEKLKAKIRDYLEQF